MVPPRQFECGAYSLGGGRSIQLKVIELNYFIYGEAKL